MICAREGCCEAAKWAPKLCVPAGGCDLVCEEAEPLAAVLSLALCTYHIAELRAVELVDPQTEGGAALRGAFATMAGEIPPAFARAWIQRVSVASPEFLKVERARAGRPN